MTKVINCSDMGSDCTFVAKGESVDEVMEIGAVHGKEVHDIQELSPEMIKMVESLIRDE